MAKKEGAQAPESASSETPTPVAPDILRKIRPVDVMEKDIKKLFILAEAAYQEKNGKDSVFPGLELFTVMGIGNGVKGGTSTYGPWEALTGQFEAIRAGDGKRFQSGVCFVPDPVGEMMIGGLKASKVEDPEASVRFAFVIGVKGADNAIGYEYTCRQVVGFQSAVDPLADLRSKAVAAIGLDAK